MDRNGEYIEHVVSNVYSEEGVVAEKLNLVNVNIAFAAAKQSL